MDTVYEDDHIIVVNKPADILSVPGLGEAGQRSVTSLLSQSYPQILVVHRLDCATSGLLILAKTKAAQSELCRQFRDREIEKEYRALCWGECQQDSGEFNQPLITDWPNWPRQKVCYTTGKVALTHYEVIERYQNVVDLRLVPITGRSHQLRVHTMIAGLPILGDRFYAPQSALNLSPRLMLHAHKLIFNHPIQQHALTLTTALPDPWLPSALA